MLDPLELVLQVGLSYRVCWELDLGPLQEQLALSAIKPSFSSPLKLLNFSCMFIFDPRQVVASLR